MTLFVTDNQDMTRLSDNVSVTNEQVGEYDIDTLYLTNIQGYD
jgi:hypothetical protein